MRNTIPDGLSEGDHYFKIHREDHNLDRCRTQFKLVTDMEKEMGFNAEDCCKIPITRENIYEKYCIS